jgi:hypothetical protein
MYRSRSRVRIAAALIALVAGPVAAGAEDGGDPADAPGLPTVAAVTRLSENAEGVPANDFCSNAVLSPDGRYAAFQTGASNLVADDRNRVSDVFIRVLKTGRIVRASVAARGEEAETSAFLGSLSPVFTPDGKAVAFASDAANFVAGAPQGVSSIYFKDLYSGALRLVSTSTRGTAANGDSARPVISRDGRVLAFASTATNLAAGPPEREPALFVKDLKRGRAGRASLPQPPDGPRGEVTFAYPDPAVFSKDGRAILFSARLSGRASESPEIHVYLRDLYSGALTRISEAGADKPGDGASRHALFSPDGAWVAFNSLASNLVQGDGNGRQDGFLKNMATGEIRRVTTTAAGGQIAGSSAIGAFTPDGTALLFSSNGDDVVPGVAVGGKWNVYWKDLASGETVLLSRGVDGNPADGTTGVEAISADGLRVLLTSSASNLVAGRQSKFPQVYMVTLER